MLYFANVIHIMTYNTPLYNNAIYAFKNGSVIEDVRIPYKTSYNELLQQSLLSNINYSENELCTMNTTISVFGRYSALQLSNLNHKMPSWIAAYNRVNDKYEGVSCHDKNSIITFEDIKGDKEKMESLIIDTSINSTTEYIYNGVKFFVDNNISVTENIIDTFKKFSLTAEDDAYTVYFDNNEMVVY